MSRCIPEGHVIVIQLETSVLPPTCAGLSSNTQFGRPSTQNRIPKSNPTSGAVPNVVPRPVSTKRTRCSVGSQRFQAPKSMSEYDSDCFCRACLPTACFTWNSWKLIGMFLQGLFAFCLLYLELGGADGARAVVVRKPKPPHQPEDTAERKRRQRIQTRHGQVDMG